MSDQAVAQPQSVVSELRVSAHLMTLEPGVFCVFQRPAPGIDGSGLPGVRLSVPPGAAETGSGIEIAGFRGDGWVGEVNDAALVRVSRRSQLLVTIYQLAGERSRAPNLQVMQINEPISAMAEPVAIEPPAGPQIDPEQAETSAHIANRGDVLGLLGEWMGEPGSALWIEGFALSPKSGIAEDDIEYQAVLGRGWLSPWVQGGQFCGSRGMALPILGLRVRLRGQAAEEYDLAISASFVDGTHLGPVSGNEALEAESLAPLEAFLVEVKPRGATEAPAAEDAAPARPARRRR